MKNKIIKMLMLISCMALFTTLLLLNPDTSNNKKAPIKQVQAFAEDTEDEDNTKYQMQVEYDYTYEICCPTEEPNVCQYLVIHQQGISCLGKGCIECEDIQYPEYWDSYADVCPD